jgi:hypothetical protein
MVGGNFSMDLPMDKTEISLGILTAKEYSTGMWRHKLSTTPFLPLYPDKA